MSEDETKIEMVIDSIRVGQVNYGRAVVLKGKRGNRRVLICPFRKKYLGLCAGGG